MKVKELIETLKTFDENTNVYIPNDTLNNEYYLAHSVIKSSLKNHLGVNEDFIIVDVK